MRRHPVMAADRWFVAWTNPHCDERAAAAMQRAGFEARVLVERREHRHNRTKVVTWRARRMMARYVFVRLPHVGAVGIVRDCDGVERVLNVGGRPLSLSSRQMGLLVGIEAEAEFGAAVEAVRKAQPFAVGDAVQVDARHRWLGGEVATIVATHGANEATVILSALIGFRPVRLAVDMLANTR